MNASREYDSACYKQANSGSIKKGIWYILIGFCTFMFLFGFYFLYKAIKEFIGTSKGKEYSKIQYDVLSKMIDAKEAAKKLLY